MVGGSGGGWDGDESRASAASVAGAPPGPENEAFKRPGQRYRLPANDADGTRMEDSDGGLGWRTRIEHWDRVLGWLG